MNETNHISPDDLALYAMDLLSDAESASLREHLAQCAECRAELDATLSDLSLYALTADMHSPPAMARQHLLKQVGREKRTAPIVPVIQAESAEMPLQTMQLQPMQLEPMQTQMLTMGGSNSGASSGSGLGSLDYDDLPQRNMAVMVITWTGWALAAGLGFFAFSLYQHNGRLGRDLAAARTEMARGADDAAKAHQVSDVLTDPNAMHATLTKPATGAIPIARVTYAADKGTLILMANNMGPLLAYKTYELWLIPADGRDPMPAGMFHPDAEGNVTMVIPDMPKGVAAKEFGVTIEDQGGAKQPTQPIIMVGM